MNKEVNNLVAFEQFYFIDQKSCLHKPNIARENIINDIVLVPTEQVLLVEVFVPGKKITDWKKALPFVLEEQLSQPIEQLFFAVLHRQVTGEKAGFISVAVVEKEKLTNWLYELKAHGLEQAQIVVDVFALPFVDNKLSSLQIDKRLLVRTDKHKGLAGSATWVKQILELEKKYSADDLEETSGVKDKIIPRSSIKELKKLTLRQGDFAIKNTNSSIWKLWMLPISLVVALLIMQMTSQFLQTNRYLEQEKLYKQHTAKLFHQMFPQTKRIVNIRAQTKAKMASFSNNKNSFGVAKILQSLEVDMLLLINEKSINVTNMQWKNKQLKLLIEAKNINILQGLVDKFSKKHEVKLKLTQLASQNSQQVSGEIYVK